MAANRNGFLIVLCALWLGSASMRKCEGKFPNPFSRHHVHVENWLQGWSQNVHCQSKDDDLGIHVLPPRSMYQWSFRINLWISTLFFCSMWWSNQHKSFVVYDANDWLYDHACGDKTCQWRATENGVFLFDSQKGSWDFMYSWDHN